jgi:hypothetical protein
VAQVGRYFDYPPGRVNYLTHISRKHLAVFVEVPKAGCTVVKRVLQHSERDGAPEPKQQSVHDRSTSPLGAPIRDRFDLDEVFGDGPYFRFGFVRNPYSRALSCYLEKIAGHQWLRDLRLPRLGLDPKDDVSFGQFLTLVAEQPLAEMDIHWAPQHYLLSLDRVTYGFLGRFESFQRDLDAVVTQLGIDTPPDLQRTPTLHITNASARLREYYDDESVELVRHVYRGDFERLGYGIDLRFAG